MDVAAQHSGSGSASASVSLGGDRMNVEGVDTTSGNNVINMDPTSEPTSTVSSTPYWGFRNGFLRAGAFNAIKPGITLSSHVPLPDSNLDVYGRFTELASRYRGAFDLSTCNITVKDQLVYELFRIFHGLLNLAKVGSLRTKDLWMPICAIQAAAVSAVEFEQTCFKLQGLVSLVPGLNSLLNLFGPNAIRSLQCTSAELVLGSLDRISGFEGILETPEKKRGKRRVSNCSGQHNERCIGDWNWQRQRHRGNCF
jgi:hypothetical protein